jgi:hypothetical protein
MIAGVEQVFHLVYEIAHWGIAWTVPAHSRIQKHEEGVLVCGGKEPRALKPGSYWFHQQRSVVYTDNVKRKVRDLPVITITTKDLFTVRVQGVLIFHITNIVTWLIENEEPDDGVLTDAQRVFAGWARSKTFEELVAWNPDRRNEDDLTRAGQAELGTDFGVRVRHLGIINGPVETVAKDLHLSGEAAGVVDSGEDDEELE